MNVKPDSRTTLSLGHSQERDRRLLGRVEGLVGPVRSPSFPEARDIEGLEYVEGATASHD